MEKKEVEKTERKKLSYEELENVCHQLSEQARSLYNKLQENDMTNAFRRLDYLFAVMDNSDTFITYGKDDFVSKCVDEIINIMTMSEEPEQEKSKEE